MIKFWTVTAANAAIILAACSNGNAESTPPSEPSTNTSQPSHMQQETDNGAFANISNLFYCDAQLNGQHYFYLDPDDVDKAVIGFKFSKAYQTAYPDEVPPSSEMTSAVSGSGMRYVNDQMEFRAKGESGFLTLSDGSTVQCNLQTRNDMANNETSDPVGGGLSFEWSANGFETLPADFEWQGSGGDTPFLMLSVPETDNFVWISECDAGTVKSYIQLFPQGLQSGDQTTLQVETDKSPTRIYPIDTGALPFGDGAGDGAFSPILIQSSNDPMFTDLASGEWGYFQLGEGDNAAKLRINLSGGSKAWNSFIPACKILGQ